MHDADAHCNKLITAAAPVLILILIRLSIDRSSIEINTRVFYTEKMCLGTRKNHDCGQKKKTEGISSAIFGIGTAAKCGKLKQCVRRSSQQNRTNM